MTASPIVKVVGPLSFHETLDPAPSIGSGTSGLKTTDDIQTALNAATAGSVVTLGSGTWDLGSGTIEIPNNVHLKGAGRGVSIIQSSALGTSAPFHGIVAPGNNSIISDLSILTTAPTTHSNVVSIRAGCTKSWDNVTFRNCHLYGGLDCVYSSGQAFGNITFENCLLEGPCDIIVHQHLGTLTFINCEMRHTTIAGQEGLSAVMVLNGAFDAGAIIKLNGCRLTMGGVTNNTMGMFALEGSGNSSVGLYAHDVVIDTNGLTNPSNDKDISVDTTGGVVLGNVRRADGRTLKLANGSVAPIFLTQPNYSCTVANLPASPFIGLIVTVTDGTGSLAWGATVTGGGSTKYLVAWNGTNWTVVGK